MIVLFNAEFTFRESGPRRVFVQAFADPRGFLPAIVVLSTPVGSSRVFPYRGTIARELLPLLHLDPETVLWVEREKADEFIAGAIVVDDSNPGMRVFYFQDTGSITRARLESLTGHRIDPGPRAVCPAEPGPSGELPKKFPERG